MEREPGSCQALRDTYWPWGAGLFATSLGPRCLCRSLLFEGSLWSIGFRVFRVFRVLDHSRPTPQARMQKGFRVYGVYRDGMGGLGKAKHKSPRVPSHMEFRKCSFFFFFLGGGGGG